MGWVRADCSCGLQQCGVTYSKERLLNNIAANSKIQQSSTCGKNRRTSKQTAKPRRNTDTAYAKPTNWSLIATSFVMSLCQWYIG
eukprot:3400957-Amphidinium_carterae.1